MSINFPLVIEPDLTTHGTGTRDLFGATVNPPAGTPGYPDAFPVSLKNAAVFDQALGVGPVAAACQKVYITTLPTVVDPTWVAYARAGGRLIICCQPPTTMTAADSTAFQAFVSALLAALPVGSFELVLWQEPQTRKHFGSNALLYHEVVAFYAPIVRTLSPALKLVYDPAMTGDADSSNPQSCLDFFPGAAYVDKWLLDWYLTSELREANPLGGLQAVAAVADPLGIPLGLGEFNVAAGPTVTTRDEWETFADLILSFFFNRLQAGLNNAEICFWMGVQSGAPDLLGEQVVALRRLHAWLA